MKYKPTRVYQPVVRREREKRSIMAPSRTNRGDIKKTNFALPNIFQNSGISPSYATRDGRIHCVSVQRTAIYKDANGNSVVLKENQQTMNVPENTRNISYQSGTKNWKKY